MSNNAAPLILLTRPEPAASRFARACRDRLGAEIAVVIAPLAEIVPLPGALDLGGIRGLIFTSEAGVSAFATRSARRDLPAWCVGDRTAQAARDVGLSAQSAAGDAETLIAAMGAASPEGPWLHLHGEDTRGDVVARLSDLGVEATGQAIYAQRPRAPDAGFRAAIRGTGPVIAPLFSPLSAERFAAALNGDRPGHVTPVALSAAVRDALPAPWRAETPVAGAPNAGEMLRAMARRISP